MRFDTGEILFSDEQVKSVTFSSVFEKVPKVVCTINTNDSINGGYANIYIRNVSITGFEVTASAALRGTGSFKAMQE
tara:strand:- start:541 stop:771 length:231 start_codon:yes stop_codon:yes gene_type:complete